MSYADPTCPKCGATLTGVGGSVDPLFDLKVAAALIPMRYASLKKFLCRHKAMFPARYRLAGDRRRRRLLSVTGINKIRETVIRGPDRPTFDELLAQFDATLKFQAGGGPAVTGDPWSLPE
ncbi:MAG: hypothetical protein E8D52_14810 [Nitrospira sp.]|nr:MAG: hypothetical protein E8D52_14810 [Nitrospira sp.]